MILTDTFNQSAQTLWDCIHHTGMMIKQEARTLFNRLSSIVNQVASAIFSQSFRIAADVAMSICVCHLYPNVFHISLVIGFLFHRQVRDIQADIKSFELCQNNPQYSYCYNLIRKIALASAIGLYSLWNMPPTLLTMAIYKGAKWGALIRAKCRENRPPLILNLGTQ